jgi:hypothetical protein
MLVLLSILILLITPPGMYLTGKFKPGFTYPWLIAVSGGLLAWVLTLTSARSSSETLQLISWEPTSLFQSSPAFLFDGISWAFSVSITALALAVLLTGIVRMQNADVRTWSGTMILAGVSLAAVNAGNPLTLMLAWAALDLTELVILLSQVNDSKVREKIVFAFSVRAGGILLVLWASVSAQISGTTLTFENIPPHANLFLLLAAGIRLGVLPLHLVYGEELNIRRGLGTFVRLAPAAASLVLLVRTAPAEIPATAVPYLLALVSLSALFASAFWAAAEDEVEGRPYWVLGMASLAAAGAILGQTAASLAWGIALLLSGGLLFLISHRHKNLLPVTILALFSFSALPFSPTWAGLNIYSSPLTVFHAALFLAQALLLAGFIRFLLSPTPLQGGLERWGWIVYPLGLVVLLATHAGYHLRNLPEMATMNLAGWIGGGAAVGLAAGLWALKEGLPAVPGPVRTLLEDIFSMRWIYRLLWKSFRTGSEMVNRINRILEGEGGVLWAFVLLAVIISWISQRVLGG